MGGLGLRLRAHESTASTSMSTQVQSIADSCNGSLGGRNDAVAKLLARWAIEDDVGVLKGKAKSTEAQLADLARRTGALEKGGATSSIQPRQGPQLGAALLPGGGCRGRLPPRHGAARDRGAVEGGGAGRCRSRVDRCRCGGLLHARLVRVQRQDQDLQLATTWAC